MKDKEEVLARMRELFAYNQMLTMGYVSRYSYADATGAFVEGHPFVSRDIQGFLPMDRHDIADLKEWLDLCVELLPPEEEIAHANYQFCGNESCDHCYRRERSRVHFGGQLIQKPREGFVVLYRINDAYGLFASAQPEKRLRAIEREWSEPLQLVHRIQTNDQGHLKELWESNFVDFAVKNHSGFFLLSDRAVETFRSCQFQDVDRDKGWKQNMEDVDLYDVTRLRHLVARNDHSEEPSPQTAAFWDFLRSRGMKV